MDYEVEDIKRRGRPKVTWKDVLEDMTSVAENVTFISR